MPCSDLWSGSYKAANLQGLRACQALLDKVNKWIMCRPHARHHVTLCHCISGPRQHVLQFLENLPVLLLAEWRHAGFDLGHSAPPSGQILPFFP